MEDNFYEFRKIKTSNGEEYAFDVTNAFSSLQMFSENGAVGDTVVRGFGRKWEQSLKDIITI